ncbi:MAG: selenocysteine-specific translation elongation factor [Candidatus Eremiobacteraeota bacterium]|nr:selenocysteine-specific translation elongation factor [Candidatus Eremiobacteraeota bacterium]
MHIVGTAGHVDHGKSSLVLALTGTNPDRWAEERLRGMTLDLGFAHLRFPDGVEAGIVDVPGHERFLHNMLAGAAGMELLLLVVAANEGVRPQTLEHLAILDFLNVRAAIVVVTKSDLVDPAALENAIAQIRRATTGTVAFDAPVVAVSSVTGAGLAALRDAIHEALSGLAPRAPEAPAFLPVDRVFALPGRGTIVTGSLSQGRLRVGDELQLTPPGRKVRVRSMHVFGEARDDVAAGSRVAVNLPGVEVREIRRGAVLAASQFLPAAAFDVRFRPVAGAPPISRKRTAVRAYLGSAEILGTLVFATPPASPDACAARLYLREAVVTYPGETFVLRAMTPKRLLGGGSIEANADAFASHVQNDDGEESPERSAVIAALGSAGIAGAGAERIAAVANVRAESAAELLAGLVAGAHAFVLARPAAYVDAPSALALLERVLTQLDAHQSEAPWTVGTTALALARALAIPEGQLQRLLAVFVEEGRVAHRHGYYFTPDFSPRLSEEQRAFFDAALTGVADQPFLPADFATVAGLVRSSKIEGVGAAFETLLAGRQLVKVGDALYRREQIEAISARVETVLRAEREMTMARFRDVVGTTRKYAVPLLEWFDANGLTLRSGDVRVLRQRR